MIGKPQWFTYRIFGWGLRPKTKEGWLYMAGIVVILGAIFLLPISTDHKLYATMALIALIMIDVIHIMTKLDAHHDERERMHQLIIERNCSFAAIAALVAVAVYESIKNAGSTMPVDLSILIVLGVMLLVKAASTIYVKAKM